MKIMSDFEYIVNHEYLLKILSQKLKIFIMDKIKKFLLKLSQKERDIIILITQKILL